MGKIRPRLSWKVADYKNNNIEVPEDIEKTPHKTEGELMSEADIEKWYIDIIRTCKVLREQDEDLFEELYIDFVADISYLRDIDKITPGQAEQLLDKNNFCF